MIHERTADNEAVRRAITWYVVWSLAALLAVSLGVVAYGGVIARNEALRAAERTARAVASGLVVPLVDDRFHARSPQAIAQLTAALDARARDGSISHIKIWEDAGAGNGRILWASERPLMGRTFPMEPDDYALFGSTEVHAQVSDLQNDENALERYEGKLVEVYAGLRDSAGEDVVFEAYMSTAALTQDARALAPEILPLPLTALIVLTLATLPLAVSLARRVDGSQDQMRRLLANAVATSDLERRRIAQDLHDGVLQDLAGASLALTADARRLPAESDVRGNIARVGALLGRDVDALRHLVADIYPPDFESRGLSRALRDLVEAEDFGDAEVTVQIDDGLAPSPLAARLAYRVTREVLRNVAKHAHATQVSVRVRHDGDGLELVVADDGVGFVPSEHAPGGHVGLRLVQETVADAGGTLRVQSTPGAGTFVQGHLPY